MIPEYEDEEAETWNVQRAMTFLNADNHMWSKNLSCFKRMGAVQRIRWWRAAKKQAQLGAPAMQALLLKVIELRLTE